MRKAGKIRDERLTAEELIRRYDKGGKLGLERRAGSALEPATRCCNVIHTMPPTIWETQRSCNKWLEPATCGKTAIV